MKIKRLTLTVDLANEYPNALQGAAHNWDTFIPCIICDRQYDNPRVEAARMMLKNSYPETYLHHIDPLLFNFHHEMADDLTGDWLNGTYVDVWVLTL